MFDIEDTGINRMMCSCIGDFCDIDDDDDDYDGNDLVKDTV